MRSTVQSCLWENFEILSGKRERLKESIVVGKSEHKVGDRNKLKLRTYLELELSTGLEIF